jgi:acetyl-CoA carboxylase biotin carboxylase subunit
MKILIANRGEIAVRIIRACREMALPAVAVYSDCDRGARHVLEADQAIHVGPSEAASSYLNIGAIIDAARRSGAGAVHPGYGFLAENAAFAHACQDAGLTFIGPDPDVIAMMGSKTAARGAAIRAGVPVVPGTEQPFDVRTPDHVLMTIASEIGYPLLVKAVSGGGGKGMRVVESEGDLLASVRTARSEAGAAFGDTSVYFERRIASARHIEIQLLGDRAGTVIPFVERECSIQRRHQKVVEESPSIAVNPDLRQRIANAAAAVARSVGYTSAGTIEFLLDQDGSFYFLEMNTRLQVEHPVTEMVAGIDLVHWQIRIARGETLDIEPSRALSPYGHAVECRIYAEDPDRGFMPSPGLVRALRPASGPGVRDDGGVSAGYTVPVYYDSMIAKLVAWDLDRPAAIARMSRALQEYQVLGIQTTIPFFQWLMRRTEFQEGRYDTTYLDQLLQARTGESFTEPDDERDEAMTVAVSLDAYIRAGTVAQSAGPAGIEPAGSRWRQSGRVAALRPWQS